MKTIQPRATRIHWTDSEKQQVVGRCVELKSLEPKLTHRKALERAQEVLPKNRRRTAHPPLVSWVRKEMATFKGFERPHRSPDDSDTSDRSQSSTGRLFERSGDSSDFPIEALIRYGVRAGVSIITRVLRDPIVRQSIAALVAESVHDLLESSRQREGDPHQISSNVLVVGLTEQQSAEFARAYRGILSVTFDRGDVASTSLRTRINEADIVIAMEGSTSSEVGNLLRHASGGYVRNTNGLSGLRQRLAELALSGPSNTQTRRRGEVAPSASREHR